MDQLQCRGVGHAGSWRGNSQLELGVGMSMERCVGRGGEGVLQA